MGFFFFGGGGEGCITVFFRYQGVPGLAWGVAGTGGHVGYRKCPTVSAALSSYLFIYGSAGLG